MRFVIWLYIIVFFTVLIINVSAEYHKVDLSNRNISGNEFFKTFQREMMVWNSKELNLSGNALNSFLDCATQLNHLEVLDLSRNSLNKLYFLCKDETYILKFLNVSHNQLEQIDERTLNHKVSKLETLDVSWNLLNGLNDTMFADLEVLEKLYLSHNPIGDNMEEFVFENLTTLKHLELKNISVSFFHAEMFKNLLKLVFLDLSLNPIEIIPVLPMNLEILDLSQTNIYRFESLKLPRLQVLRINNMQNLSSVNLNDFEKCPKLNSLSMRNSTKLKELTMWLPKPHLLSELRYLDIQDDAIKTLIRDLQLMIEEKTKFKFQNNPWHCDCKVEIKN